MSPLANSVRGSLFVQAALTVIFSLVGSNHPTGVWQAGAIGLGVAAVALGASLKSTPTTRTAILGFEAVAVALGVLTLALGEGYIVGTVLAVFVLIRIANAPASDFVGSSSSPYAVGDQAAAPAPGAAAWPAAPAPGAPWPAAPAQAAAWPAAPAPGAPWPAAPAQVAAWPAAPVPAPAAWAAPAPSGFPVPAQVPAPLVGAPAFPSTAAPSRTVLPEAPMMPSAPVHVAVPEAPMPPAAAYEAQLELAAAAAIPIAPEPPVAPLGPLTANACLTILPG